MKAKSLLAQAAKCKTDADAHALLAALRDAFCATKALRHLGTYNDDASMEGDQPLVRFELNQKISDEYITMIRPEIRDGKLVVDVVTNRMTDGLGMQSKSWEVVDGLEDVLPRQDDDVENGMTIAQLANLARDAAIANHADLIERVGVRRELALKVAKKSW